VDHEVRHQIGFSVRLPGMELGPGGWHRVSARASLWGGLPFGLFCPRICGPAKGGRSNQLASGTKAAQARKELVGRLNVTSDLRTEIFWAGEFLLLTKPFPEP